MYKNVHDLFYDGHIVNLPIYSKHLNLVCGKDNKNIYNWNPKRHDNPPPSSHFGKESRLPGMKRILFFSILYLMVR